MRKAIFIDKDGTLIRNVPYNVDPDKIQLEHFAIEGLRLLQQKGYLIVVISNQAGVAHGYFSEDALQPVIGTVRRLLADGGIRLDGFYYCPHHPAGKVEPFAASCTCRKPAPGMIIRAAIDLDISLGESWMIGDILHDVEAGNRAGCQSILINNGNETEWVINPNSRPEYIVKDLLEAATMIANHSTTNHSTWNSYIRH
ncbi:D-glycero-alpha-D-manno-heptose-1,7-bisphosphate 7-phosphatase [Chitinophaga rhizophila]|uniref:D,D-heptose 1,7-bisphosphate phosphatase n=1 Tax=Chitinophaga rhizophila TaxID=2866212 RepID=A0ABS7G535_9BACT|nr:HAD family hydrolase [Chitinophaga rhizophila]MBW8682763.1 HAD family hydrolase [Chitinophaga rhizophila]